jgi:SAM-dependent methyltransferase
MPQTRKPTRPDRYLLYEKAVQEPQTELALVERLLKRGGRPARRLREDFSGTALLSATWVARGPGRSAMAVDLDPAMHDWARAHRLPGLGAAAQRLQLVNTDVRRGPRGRFDAVIALNFSYQIFQTRTAMKQYLSNVRRALAPGGVFVLDVFGGWLTQRGLTERRRLGGGITYVWEQGALDPITHRIHCSIHFERTGRRLPHPFHYHWRLWTIPELCGLFDEVGFADLEVLWDVEPPGVEPRYLPRRRAVNQSAWLAYLVGRRPLGRPSP